MQSRNSASLFVAKTEEIESGSNPVSLNMSLIIRVNITFDAVWFIGLLGIVLSDDELSTQLHTVFRMPMNSSAFLQIIGCFIISTDGYSWKWDSYRRVGLASLNLKRRALERFQGYEASNKEINWAQFYIDVVSRFSPSVYDSLMEQITKLK